MNKTKKTSRRGFLQKGALAAGLAGTGLFPAEAAGTRKAGKATKKTTVIDSMMHLEVYVNEFLRNDIQVVCVVPMELRWILLSTQVLMSPAIRFYPSG